MNGEIEWQYKVTVVFMDGKQKEFLSDESYSTNGDFVCWSYAKVDGKTLFSYSIPSMAVREIFETQL